MQIYFFIYLARVLIFLTTTVYCMYVCKSLTPCLHWTRLLSLTSQQLCAYVHPDLFENEICSVYVSVRGSLFICFLTYQFSIRDICIDQALISLSFLGFFFFFLPLFLYLHSRYTVPSLNTQYSKAL